MQKSLWNRIGRDKYLLLLVLPCIIYYIVFKYAPMFGIAIAFQDYNLFKGVAASHWVGFKYFHLFIHNPDSWIVVRNTFLLGFYSLFFGFPIPIVFALLLNELKQMLFKRIVQTISYIPHFISNVVVSGMIIMFLSPRGGILNQMLGWFGAEPINFLNHSELFRSIYVTSGIWQHMGWSTIIYMAALAGVDPGLYEASCMDGASRWKQALHVTLPGILPVMSIMLLLHVGLVLEVGFEKVFLLYNPVTYQTADIISTFVYRTGLVDGQYSYAAAIDLFTGIVSFIFVYSSNGFSRRLTGNSLW